MDKIQNAAIIILGMGDKCASEILKNMTPKEVQRIMEAINQIDKVTEEDVIRALNEFFRDNSKISALDYTSKENIKNSLSTVIGMRGIEGPVGDSVRWMDRLKKETVDNVIDYIIDEHPQVITAVIALLAKVNGDKASQVAKALPKALQTDVIKRMTKIKPMSAFAVDALATFFNHQFDNPEERYSVVAVDGLTAAADIMSYLDSDTEREIIADLSTSSQDLADKVQDKILPFEKLATMDKKSLQGLIKELPSEDLTVALKGADVFVRNIFMKSMSSKSADILKDEMESMGPVKLTAVIEAQKRIVIVAKKLAEEEKITLSTKQDDGMIS